MSITRQVTVWCEGCGQWEQASATAKRLRKELRRKGWKSKGTKDWCPNCKDKSEEEVSHGGS